MPVRLRPVTTQTDAHPMPKASSRGKHGARRYQYLLLQAGLMQGHGIKSGWQFQPQQQAARRITDTRALWKRPGNNLPRLLHPHRNTRPQLACISLICRSASVQRPASSQPRRSPGASVLENEWQSITRPELS